MRVTSQKRHGIIFVIVENRQQGLGNARDLLYKKVNKKTALFISGGSTPKPLYEILAKEKKLRAGAVAFVDERYGMPFHKDSNERMIKETGLIDYLSSENIPFYSILNLGYSLGSNLDNLGGSNANANASRLESVGITVKEYDKIVRELFSSFPKRVAIMGIGEDGHTAGLPARTQNSKLKTQKYVTEIRDFPGEFKERITLTFRALSQMDLLIVLVFGGKKKRALGLMFTDGSIEEVPARFFKRPDISKKTILITDQKV